MKHFQAIVRYLKYFWRSKSKYAVNSPFVFDLYSKVILSKRKFYAFDEIGGIRQMLEKNDQLISVTDFGAGSQIDNSKQKKISAIAKNSAKKDKVGRILTSLTDHFQPKTALEMGTSLGISCLYQYSGCKKAQWITMEGCPETAKVAQKVFSAFKADNIEIVVGDFGKTLQPTIEKIDQLDYAFFDGNHQEQPTIEYFETCLKKAHDGSLFIFDDIHWSAGMEAAWDYIKSHPEVTVTIDLFFIGLVFFKKDLSKEDFTLRI